MIGLCRGTTEKEACVFLLPMMVMMNKSQISDRGKVSRPCPHFVLKKRYRDDLQVSMFTSLCAVSEWHRYHATSDLGESVQ